MTAGGGKQFRVSWLKTQKPKFRRNPENTIGVGETSNGTHGTHSFTEENSAVSAWRTPPEGNQGRGDSHVQDFDETF